MKFYTTTHSPKLYFDNSKLYFAFAKIDTSHSTTDTLIRVDMTYQNHLSGMKLYNARIAPQGYLNYYLAQCSSGIIGVHGYQQLFLKGIYKGVDALYYGNSSGLKYYLICQDRFTPSGIKIKYTGADSVRILGNGKLMVYTKLGTLKFESPTAYQLDNNGNIITLNWSPTYTIAAANTISFNLGSYDITKPLIITVVKGHKPSPQGGPEFTQGNLDWCTYYGDYDDDLAFDVCNNANNGETFMCGRTLSDDFPTTAGVSQTQYGGSNDGFVVKFNKSAERNWATFYGGEDFDALQSVSYNTNLGLNQLYVIGKTISTELPVISSTNQNSFNDPTNNGDYDGFLVRFDPNFGTVAWATYFGGGGYDDIRSIVFDSNGSMDLVGNTTSTIAQNNSCLAPTTSQFPLCNSISANCYYQTTNAGSQDCFFAKFNSSDQLLWSTFFGSSADDEAFELTHYFDNDPASNDLYATGLTYKITTNNQNNCGVRTDGGFPVCDMSGSNDYFQLNNSGQQETPNAFIANFNLDGTLRWSTLFNRIRDFQTITQDNKNKFVTVAGINSIGTAVSGCTPQTGLNIPICTPAGAFSEYEGQLYIARFNTDQNSLVWSTLYNGTNNPDSWVDISQSVVTDPGNGALPYFDKFMDAAYDADHNLYLAGGVFEYDFETLEKPGFYFQPELNFGYDTQPTGITDCFLAGFATDNKRFLATHFGGAYTTPFTLDYPRDFDVPGALSTYVFGGFFGPCDDECSVLYMVGYTGRSEDNQTLFPVYDAGSGAYYFTQDNPNFGSYQWNSFITRFDLTDIEVGIPELQDEDHGRIKVYPNPASNEFTLKFESEMKGQIEIVIRSSIGAIIQAININSVFEGKTISVDVSDWASGMYLISVSSGQGIYSSKFIKQ